MKRVLILAAFACVLAPAAALATPTPAQQASKDCSTLRAKIGAAAFAQAFGTFGRCVSNLAQAEQASLAGANTLCRAEQADPSFASTHGGRTFAQFYGTGNAKNAFGNCVSLKVRSSARAAQAALNPSRACSGLRTQLGRPLFALAFGTNASHANAFGKCVSLVARSQVSSVVAAATACRDELADASFAASHDGKTFAQYYGTNSDLSNAFGNCVARKLGVATAKLQTALSNASKTCRTMRSSDPTGFRSKYGSRANAFAKCVVAHARAK